MDNKDEPKKPNRLKFSRLCLSQTRNAASTIRTNTQLPNSQISRFFSQSNTSDDVPKTDNTTPKQIGADICSQSTANSCDKLSLEVENGKRKIETSDEQPNDITKKQTERKKSKGVQRIDKTADTKSTIKSFFSNDHNDSMADFEIPAKVAKRPPKPMLSKTTKSTRVRRKQPDIRKVLKKQDTQSDDYSHLPEDAQLELALAMSKATAEASSQPINLDVFEFKPTNSKMGGNEFYEFFNMPKKTNARFKWNSKCTQLTRRKDDVQKSKVREKIDELLLNNIIVESSQSKRSESPILFTLPEYTPDEIYSNRLQRICISERILFEINGCELHSKSNILSYYTNNLVERSELEAGVLLRDWSKIPGRDSIYDCLTNEINKTETTVISSQTHSTSGGGDDNDEQESTSRDANVIEQKDMEMQQQYLDTPMEVQDEEQEEDRRDDQSRATQNQDVDNPLYGQEQVKELQNDAISLEEDADATVVIESNDIQSKVDAINSKIRLSQNISDMFQPAVFSYESTSNTIRAPSPDLFDDEDDYEMTDITEEEKKVEEKVENTPHNEDTVETNIPDVIEISSSEGNSNQIPESNKSIQNSPQIIDSEETITNDNPIVETIELLDSDSENMLKDPTDLPVDVEDAGLDESCHNFYNYEYENEDFIRPFDVANEAGDENMNENNKSNVIEEENENENTSSKSNESAVIPKKLSFTERLELYEKDMLNGFNQNLPPECYSQSQSQSQLNQSQESIALSDDEINYSMRKGAGQVMDNDDFNMEEDYGNYDYYLPSPIDFNLIDGNSNMESDEKLMNQSICNILEKTFDHCTSPISSAAKTQTNGRKSLKKFSSEAVLSSRYSSAIPSTSKASAKTPDKKAVDLESQPTNSPFSQPVRETRMDLSNEEYEIRIGSVSPKPNYEQMDASTVEMELRKFGLKPSLRRRQAIICLEYIYNRTHPFIENLNEEKHSPEKESKTSKDIPNDDDDDEDSGAKINFNIGFAAHNLVDEKFKKREVNKIFLPSALRAKKPWCLEPLHIAWHNLLKANSDLRKAVLLYEPINLTELKKFFKTIDMTFDNRDLISFLDLHCITFRMNNQHSRNKN